MRLRIGWIIFGLALLLAVPVSAKGRSDRIILTGPLVEGEVILTDPAYVFPLSMGSLEDLRTGVIAEPDNPGDMYYELERQYEAREGVFQTFDRARYYPGEGDSSGFIYYLGIENGSSGYDKHWFRAMPTAKLAFETIFDPNARPYVVLMNDAGFIHFADPNTLEDILNFEGLEYPQPVVDFVDGIDTHTIYFNTRLSSLVEHFRLNLSDLSVCRVDTLPISTAEMAGDLWVAGEIAERLSKNTPGARLEPIGMGQTNRVLLYHPLGRYHVYDFGAEDRGEIPGGVIVASTSTNRIVDNWQSDLDFAQVISGGEQLYGLHAPRDSDLTELYVLDAASGEVLASRELDRRGWHIGYGVLDLSRTEALSRITFSDTCRYQGWELASMFRFTPQLWAGS